MKLERTKYKRTTPKGQVEYSTTSIQLGGATFSLLKAAGKVLAKHFGLLYLNTSHLWLGKGDDQYSDYFRPYLFISCLR